MAADTVNKMTTGCAECSTGDPASVTGFEGKRVPTTDIREVTQTSGAPSNPGTKGMNSKAAAPGTRIHRIGTTSLNVADPFTGSSAMGPGIQGSTMMAAESGAGSPADIPDAITSNLSSRGFAGTSESEVHRYETTLTSDDFLTLNSSQKNTLATSGFASVSADKLRSYRDVTYYTFSNTATGNTVYVMAVQQLDASGNAIGEQQYSISPEFPLQPGASRSGTAGMATASTIDRNGSCFWNWVAVSLLIAVLILDIVSLITAGNLCDGDLYFFGSIEVSIMVVAKTIAIFVMKREPHGMGLSLLGMYEINSSTLYAVGILTGLTTLILLAYEIYRLGVCMKWWDEISWESIAWAYQERAGYADNGKILTATLHDRIAVALPVNTSADKKATWVPDLPGAGGIVLKDTKSEKVGNITIQSWLIEADKEGQQQLTFRYSTTAPVPPDISTTVTITLSVLPGNWKTMFIDNSSSRYGTGLYTSLAFDKAGTPHISYYDAGAGLIRYASWNGTGWAEETVASSAGTYSTSLAFDKTGTPAISFGDGYHFGNLVFATRNGTIWETTTVARGSAGDAGQDSSLAFDKNGSPHITYNDGQYYATLKYATRNGTAWEVAPIDTGGPLGDAGYGSSLKFDAQGFPHVAYTSGKHFASLMYAYWNGMAWSVNTVDTGGGVLESTGFTPSLAFDSRGFPHISYYDAEREDLMYASMYASWNGISWGWRLESVDSINDVGAFSSLAIDAGDRPHISYYDAANHELRYATKSGDTWIKRTIDNDGNVGQFSSMALDPAGHPCFAYFDDTHHALKYAGWVE